MVQKIKSNIINIPGWRTNRKIVVFESDDWGMIRMASKGAYRRLLKKGYPVDQCAYNSNDALESNEDLESLMEVLDSVKDKNGNPAKFTLNNIVANPDFQKIKESEFQNYFHELFTTTLRRYSDTERVIDLYREGRSRRLFQVQFHGREHVNINRWLEALKKSDRAFKDAFNENMFTVASGPGVSGRRDFLDSFGMAYASEKESMESIITSGAALFENIWGFRPKSFIAPCYVWTSDIEKALHQAGVRYIQGTHIQRVPEDTLELKIKRQYHFQGQKNRLGMRYLIRNAFFEPTESKNGDREINNTLHQISIAFKWNKPAIISSHRVNFIGRINPKNRDDNLKLLSQLLNSIIKTYPDAEFMSSDDLGTLMDND